ncbi:MAG: TonB-dependent receptor [Pedobacter sp.]|nr:MAG: TonB-dependent receptor [Pedobacter sp.]
MENMEGNPNLKPEKSDNVNLGFIYTLKINDESRFLLSSNAIYRNSTDFIFRRIIGGTRSNRDNIISENRDGVRTTGIDGEIRYSFKNWLSIGTTLTYQNLTNLQQYDWDAVNARYYDKESLTYLDRMPNIPFFFGNSDISGTFENVFARGNNLTVGYNLLYVHSFWLDWPSFGNPNSEDKNQIPAQISHDVNLVEHFHNSTICFLRSYRCIGCKCGLKTSRTNSGISTIGITMLFSQVSE